MIELIKIWISGFNISPFWAHNISVLISIILISLLCIILYFISKKIILKIIEVLVKNSKTTWDDVFLEKGVFAKLANLVPALIILAYAYSFPKYTGVIHRFYLLLYDFSWNTDYKFFY